jgi:hypothetical protein
LACTPLRKRTAICGCRVWSLLRDGKTTGVLHWALPDPIPYADYENPQTLNLYQYVENNPLNAWDPDGHAHWGPCPNDSSMQCWTGDKNGDVDQKNGTPFGTARASNGSSLSLRRRPRGKSSSFGVRTLSARANLLIFKAALIGCERESLLFRSTDQACPRRLASSSRTLGALTTSMVTAWLTL